jgi:DNA-binding CsgD family transcriptional regulator
MSSGGAEPALRGRRRECEALDRLLSSARSGRSAVLVLHGAAGVGKTALVRYLVERAGGFRLARVVGVESEIELAYAGLHQLCLPFLDRLDRLPPPQRDALGTALGLRTGEPPDLFLVGLAVLTLLSDVAEEQPLLCVLDDAHWLDEATAQTLSFVARRLLAEPLVLLFAVRDAETGLGTPLQHRRLLDLPQLALRGLSRSDAMALLESVLTGPVDERVRERIVAETGGNPLALLQLPRGLPPGELSFGLGEGEPLPLASRIEEGFVRRLDPLPPQTRLLLLIAAVEPVGDLTLLWRAADRLGVGTDALGPAEAAGLISSAAQVLFRHPLVRSAVFRAASPEDRQKVHAALAEATDPDLDPDRRAWHRAQSTPALDEDVAAELERSAGRAETRGGLAAAAAFLERAVALTPGPARRSRRAFAAAQAHHHAGASEAALHLLALAEAGPLDELDSARAQLLRAQIVFAVTRGREAPPLLLEAAKRLERVDAGLARETYLDAFSAALFAGRLVVAGDMREIAEAVLGVDWGGPLARTPRACDLLLEALAALIVQGYPAGAPGLKRALITFRDEPMPPEDALRWLWLACRVARGLADDVTWDVLTERQVQLARNTGELSVLPIALTERFSMQVLAGNLGEARSLVAEADAVLEATGSRLSPHIAFLLAAWQGREDEALALLEARRQEVAQRGEGLWLASTDWTSAVLFNGLGRYDEALAAAERAAEYPDELGLATWVPPELIEAAVRSGRVDRAWAALPRFSEVARACDTDWALGVEARCRALLAEGASAEALYREAIERLGRTRVTVTLARARLLYGEWLRRENRRVDAREQLRSAHKLFSHAGAEAFAERARRELRATGETARTRTHETRGVLTSQEAQIARLAQQGLSNPEIGAQLFISPRTVQYHLRKVFQKLEITSRNQLGRVPSTRLGVA